MLNKDDNLGLYTIIRLLGRGGMGEVYEVEHEVLRKRFALKILPEDFAGRSGALERFKREAEVMANLDHPNIIKVDEFGQVGGRHWLRMELAKGGTVNDREVNTLGEYASAKGGQIDPDEGEVIFSQILEGLAHAHKHGVIHRDLKPANILICSDVEGNATFKISDFGLVRMVGEEWVLSQADQSIRLSMSLGQMKTEAGEDQAGTATRSMLGTYEYMSPEQKRGEDTTPASDVYAIGLMMYRLLTGRTQLGRKGVSDIVPGAPDWWDDLVDKAVEDSASLRFADAGEMLTAFQAGHTSPVEASQPSTREIRGANRDAAINPAQQRFVPGVAHDKVSSRRGPEKNPILADKPVSPANQPSVSPPPAKKKTWAKIVVGLVAAAFVGLAVLLGVIWLAGGKPVGMSRSKAYRAPQTPGTSNTQQNMHDKGVPVPGENWKSLATGMEFVWIPALECWVGKYEVTNGEYRNKESSHDSTEFNGHSLNGDRQPVVYVNFDDAKAYAAWLTDKDKAVLGGTRYRLPTNDEFMTYAQCGDGREYPWGNNWPPRSGQAGNYSDSSSAWSYKIDGYRDGHPVTCNVEQSWANSWGLYGVGGNVWECASESPAGSFGAWRGASWGYFSQDALRCSYRSYSGGSFRSIDLGFRLLLCR